MRSVSILVAFAGLAHADCIAVSSDKILARDVAGAVPLFQALDPETVIAFSPFPGTQRVLDSSHLLLAARGHGLSFPPGEQIPSVCVERIVHTLTIEEVSAALVTAINRPNWHFEVLEFSNKPVPPGRLVFSIGALNRTSENCPPGPVSWPGELIYDGYRSLSVWAKVRLFVDTEIFVAKGTIAKGTVIRAEDIETVHRQEFPLLKSVPGSISSIVGKAARRDIPAGQRIITEMLENPKDVVQGETVHVKVVNGAATITLDAIAQGSGYKGETIVVHNPSTGKNFRAFIEDRGRVLVVPSGPSL